MPSPSFARARPNWCSGFAGWSSPCATDGVSVEQLLPCFAQETGPLPNLRMVFRCKPRAGNAVIKSP
eukprot:6260450-Lingulodinium_polyedra.AAC.1